MEQALSQGQTFWHGSFETKSELQLPTHFLARCPTAVGVVEDAIWQWQLPLKCVVLLPSSKDHRLGGGYSEHFKNEILLVLSTCNYLCCK